MRIAPTNDIEAIAAVLSHPAVYPWVSDDLSPEALTGEEVLMPEGSRAFLIRRGAAETLAGALLFEPRNGITWVMHVAMLPEHRGEITTLAITEACRWMFRNGDARKIVAEVPGDNLRCLRQLARVGFVGEGCVTESYLRSGVLLDLHILGLKETDLCLG